MQTKTWDPWLADQPALMQWPADSGRDRIHLIGTFNSPSDLGFRADFMSRFKNFLGGGRERRLVRPYAIDEDERWLVIADPGAGLVFCLDKHRKKYSIIEYAGEQALSSPVGVALHDNGVYVADSALGKVFRFDDRQSLVSSLEFFARPTSLAYDRQNKELYVTDTLNHGVLVLDERGSVIRRFGMRGTKAGEFNYPSHITLMADRLLIVDAMNFRVQVLSLEGEYLGSFGVHGDQQGYFAQPKGIAVDQDGHVYVAESLSGLVQIFDMEGFFLLAFGGEGRGPNELLLPAGIHIEGNRIYVADSGNGRVQVFRYEGAP